MNQGELWKVVSDLLVTRLGTCMLVRSLVLENRYGHACKAFSINKFG